MTDDSGTHGAQTRAAALAQWGWDAEWEASYARLDDKLGVPGRVTGQERARWTVFLPGGPAVARTVSPTSPQPVTGDWVVLVPGPGPTDPHSVASILPRRTAFTRGSAGDGQHEQVLAANMDHVWIVDPLDSPPNLRRIERYLTVAWQSGAMPGIVLTKSDLAVDLDLYRSEVAGVALGVTITAVSSGSPDTVAALRENIHAGQTVVLLGPSGAGKSTLVNLLSGSAVAETGEVRDRDRKGRHTTTRRELFLLNDGGVIMDTPGLRELRLWDSEEGLAATFGDIEGLAEHCRFVDCQHDTEPGCAVITAVASGELPADRLASFRKLQAEAAHERRKADHRARKAAVSEHRSAMKTLRFHPKRRDRDGL